MKNRIVIFFYLLQYLVSATIAQPTLTGSILPVVNTSFTFYQTDIVAVGAAGANIIWDFSALNVSDTTLYEWLPASTSSYADTFPGAEIVAETVYGTDFIITSGGDYQRVGLVINDVNLASFYHDPEDFIRIPVDFNDQYTDDFASDYQSPFGTTYRRGSLTFHADAYGTLILPYDTFLDVMRIQISEDIVDSTLFANVNSTLNITAWYSNDYGAPLLSYIYLESINGTTEIMQYLSDEGIVSIGFEESRIENNVLLYPNPCLTACAIHYNSTPQKIQILNIQGKLINEFLDITENSYFLNTSQYQSGNYIVKLVYKDKAVSKYLIKD